MRGALVVLARALTWAAPAQAQPAPLGGGAWSWFGDPRAVTHNGKTFVGWVDLEGDIKVSSYHHANSPYDSGGLTLDHDDPSRVYLSRQLAPGSWRVESWTTPDAGATWSSQTVSASETQRNVRPISPRGMVSPFGDDLSVIWMRGAYPTYEDYTTEITALTLNSNQPPVADAEPSVRSGPSPLEVRFDASPTDDPDGGIATWAWDFGDRTSGASGTGQPPEVPHIYTDSGRYFPALPVTDAGGASSTLVEEIAVDLPSPPTTHTGGAAASTAHGARRPGEPADPVVLRVRAHEPVRREDPGRIARRRRRTPPGVGRADRPRAGAALPLTGVGGQGYDTGVPIEDVRDGTWHHLVATKSGAQARLYVDGAVVHSGGGADPDPAHMPWHVMRNGSNNAFSEGEADEIALYTRALTGQEARRHYDIARQLAARPLPPETPDPVVDPPAAGTGSGGGVLTPAVPARTLAGVAYVRKGRLIVRGARDTPNRLAARRRGLTWGIADALAPLQAGAGCRRLGPRKVSCRAAAVKRIEMYGGAGADVLTVVGRVRALLVGGPGVDRLAGGRLARFRGGPGADRVRRLRG